MRIPEQFSLKTICVLRESYAINGNSEQNSSGCRELSPGVVRLVPYIPSAIDIFEIFNTIRIFDVRIHADFDIDTGAVSVQRIVFNCIEYGRIQAHARTYAAEAVNFVADASARVVVNEGRITVCVK